MKTKTALMFMAVALAASVLAVPPSAEEQAFQRRLKMAEFHLKNFEREVKLARGGDKQVWHEKDSAMQAVQELHVTYGEDPRVQELFLRARKALMASKGHIEEVQTAWTQYKRNEEKLRKIVWAEGEKAWKEFLAEAGTNVIERVFPAPDPQKISFQKLEGTYVVLDDVRYPMNQFYGGNGEYIHCGKPSEGYYYVHLSGGRQWLGAYEAVKRYRRNVDSGLQDVQKWTLLGQITGLTLDFPDASADKIGNMYWGWVVTPVALMVPDHVVSFYKDGAPSSGAYAGEEKVDAVKESFYTVKTIPQNVQPKQLMEIFFAAIREKNFKLYQQCIDPKRQETPLAEDQLRYHWDLHQERFHGEYVTALFGEPKFKVVKGFDKNNNYDSYFLDDDQKKIVEKGNGPVVREAYVESRAIDENGKQLGSPQRHTLIQRADGRWYVSTYEIRF